MGDPKHGEPNARSYLSGANWREWPSNAIQRFFDVALRPTGLTSTQYQILRLVAQTKTTLILKDVARAMGLSLSNLSRKIVLLEQTGLIELTRDTRDRRVRLPRLTDLGRTRFRLAHRLWQTANQHYASGQPSDSKVNQAVPASTNT